MSDQEEQVYEETIGDQNDASDPNARLKKKHQTELKEFRLESLRQKKSIPTSDKKRRKQWQIDNDKALETLAARHQQELADLISKDAVENTGPTAQELRELRFQEIQERKVFCA